MRHVLTFFNESKITTEYQTFSSFIKSDLLWPNLSSAYQNRNFRRIFRISIKPLSTLQFLSNYTRKFIIIRDLPLHNNNNNNNQAKKIARTFIWAIHTHMCNEQFIIIRNLMPSSIKFFATPMDIRRVQWIHE